MKITESDIKWLELHYPNLHYESNSQKVLGELDFCAEYDDVSDILIIRGNATDPRRFLCDVFEIEICLGTIDGNGWPIVYEVGGRRRAITKKLNVDSIDLHFYSVNAACCLGLKFKDNRHLGLRNFLEKLVIPFFYRLAYTDKFGIAASQNDLWGEYSHGEEGPREYRTEISNYAKQNPGRNGLCPCGSGRKYKKCHLSEVESLKRY